MLQARNELKNTASARHPSGRCVVFRRLFDLHDLLKHSIKRFLIKHSLFEMHLSEMIDGVLFGQIGNDGLISFHPSEHEGRREAAESFCRAFVMIGFNRTRKDVREFLHGAEELGLYRREDGPEFHQTVFHRRARHGNHLLRLDAAHGCSLRRAGIFHRLGFIDDEQAPLQGREQVIVSAQRAVARQQHVGHVDSCRELPVGAVVYAESHCRGKLCELSGPVGDQRSGQNGEDLFLFQFSRILQFKHGADNLKRFAKPHVVGNQRTEAQLRILHEPRVAARLIGTQCCLKAFGRLHIGDFGNPL